MMMQSEAAVLTIDGLLLGQDMMTKPLTFIKHAPLPENLIRETQISTHEDECLPNRPVRQLRTQTPNSAIYHDLPSSLKLRLGECIGHGRSGVVFRVEPEGLATDAPNETLLPLVAKFGRQDYNKWLLREAWFYEEMQTIQGVVIPWCYGLYSAQIPKVPSQVFLPWVEGWKRSVYHEDHVMEIDSLLVQFYQESDGKDDQYEEDLEVEQDALEQYGNLRDQYSDFVRELSDETEQYNTVVVLMLEELGEPYLPEGGKNWPMNKHIPKRISKEIYDAYGKLHELGIIHNDIKHENILKAPVRTSPSLQDNNMTRNESNDPDQATNSGATDIKCRIVDFELSMKTNCTIKLLNSMDKSYLERLINSARSGSPIGQYV